MTKDEALKLALEALEESVDLVREDYENAKKLYGKYPSRQARLLGMEDGLLKHENAITAIKQALAAPVQEPVKPRCKVGGMPAPGHMCPMIIVGSKLCGEKGFCPHQEDTTPPAAQRQWVGLTPREIYNLWEDSGVPFVDWDSFASITRAIEAKLRNKNGWRQQHVTDGNPCWCEPETRYTDPETGASVIVHKDPQ